MKFRVHTAGTNGVFRNMKRGVPSVSGVGNMQRLGSVTLKHDGTDGTGQDKFLAKQTGQAAQFYLRRTCKPINKFYVSKRLIIGSDRRSETNMPLVITVTGII